MQSTCIINRREICNQKTLLKTVSKYQVQNVIFASFYVLKFDNQTLPIILR